MKTRYIDYSNKKGSIDKVIIQRLDITTFKAQYFQGHGEDLANIYLPFYSQ